MDPHDEMNERFGGLFPATLGLAITVAEKDRVVGTMVVRPAVCTTGNILHGGAVMALADTLGAVGTFMNLGPGQRTATLESKTNFFAAAPEGTTVTATATPLHRGRQTQVWQTNITNEAGRLVAQVTQTQFVMSA